ncbi:hypothetical protein UlMin_006542 [Ulmus minor]
MSRKCVFLGYREGVKGYRLCSIEPKGMKLIIRGIINYEPKTYSDAMRCKDSSKWKLAMEKEMHSLMKNNTWEFVSKPNKHRVVDCKWIFKIKEGNSPGDKVRYKARLVAKGFTQREGIDYT